MCYFLTDAPTDKVIGEATPLSTVDLMWKTTKKFKFDSSDSESDGEEEEKTMDELKKR